MPSLSLPWSGASPSLAADIEAAGIDQATRTAIKRRMHRLFYGCSYVFHLSGNNRRNSHFMGS